MLTLYHTLGNRKEIKKMAIEWTENLSVGVGTIDEQHKNAV